MKGAGSKVTDLSLFALNASQVPPLLDSLSEVNCIHGHFDLTDLVVLRKAVKVEDGEHERLGGDLGVRDLGRAGSHGCLRKGKAWFSPSTQARFFCVRPKRKFT